MESEYHPASNVMAFLDMRIGEVMRTDVAILEFDDSVQHALNMMQEKNTRSVLVSAKGEVVGLVSKTDVLFKVTSQGKNPSKVKVREIMSSPVVAVSPQASVGEALEIMDKKKVRQLMVHAFAAPLGMVYREDVSEKIEKVSRSIESEAISGAAACIIDTRTISYTKDMNKANFQCAYCGSPFDTKEGLSKHIDRMHEEAGVLEGDYRKLRNV
ncbi:MAG TPA: CBS domain-containing protein [Nitrososphaera sp.]|nr:CBS domain-containing protein [Nitrososphaera sp.]